MTPICWANDGNLYPIGLYPKKYYERNSYFSPEFLGHSFSPTSIWISPINRS